MQQKGIILLNKEKGVSSNTAVNRVKHILNAQKAGHLGTLDVLAEGLLPITINKATKLFDYFLSKDKVYKTIFKFGETSDTLDLEGEITQRDDKIITKQMVLDVIPSFIGKQNQMPPLYSAKKIKGQKAYNLARKGEVFDLKEKEIEIYDLKLLNEIDKNTFEFLVHCSSGTYIRSLCRDIAHKLSTCGIMLYLQRTKCGIFDIERSFTIEDIKNGKYDIIEPDILFDYEKYDLTDSEFLKLQNGQSVVSEKYGLFKAYYRNEYLGNIRIENGLIKFELKLF